MFIRDKTAALFRALPSVRGKGRIGVTLSKWLTDYQKDEESIVTFKMRDGSLMRIDLRSRTEGWTFWTGEYDRQIIELFSACIQPEWVVLDVGANVGFWSVPIGRKLKDLGGTLYTFEPVKTNFDRLVEVIRLNGLEGVVRPFNVALGDEEGIIQISMESNNNAKTGNAVILKEESIGETTSARITLLDKLAQEQNIKTCHLIKVDIEGAEFTFLKGAASFIKEHRPIIYGEFNVYWMRQFGHSFLDIADLTLSWNYCMYKYLGKKSFTEISKPAAGIENVLLVPQETADKLLTSLNIHL